MSGNRHSYRDIDTRHLPDANTLASRGELAIADCVRWQLLDSRSEEIGTTGSRRKQVSLA
jgi:hypothetical protein